MPTGLISSGKLIKDNPLSITRNYYILMDNRLYSWIKVEFVYQGTNTTYINPELCILTTSLKLTITEVLVIWSRKV